jgi:putative transposase
MIPHAERLTILGWIDDAVAGGTRRDRACAVIGLTIRTAQRWMQPCADGSSACRTDARPTRVQHPANALSAAERAAVLAAANSPEYGALPPSQIVPRLADAGIYLGSESTFYRCLRTAGQLAHRRPEQAPHARAKPRALSATGPDQLVSWDITYLKTDVRGIYLYLYVFMDVFSRKIVAWQVHTAECQIHASALFADYAARAGIGSGRLTLHSDNGAAMKGATLLATLERLGVARSLSRPSVSNDNPYSEALFRTLKYRPDNPLRPFAALADARAFAHLLIDWYNHEHRHSAIGFVTPAQRHADVDRDLLARRDRLYQTARAKHPRRWSGKTRNWNWCAEVHLNPEKPCAG